jgi:hypothetical protein
MSRKRSLQNFKKMNNKSLILIPILFQISFAYCQTTTKEFPVLKGPYLGQTPPGTTPVVFAPGIVSTGLYTRDITITNDGKEIYFCISDPFITGIFVTKQVDGAWTEPVIAPFSGKEFLDMEPHISPDGKKFFFLSNRPPPGKEQKPGWFYQKLWFMDKTISGWSDPKLVEEPVNSDENEFFPSTTNENVLYFTRSGKSGKPRIYKSVFINGKYQEPAMLPINIPETGMLFNAYISPKEDFLITCAQGIDSTNADQDYYITFKTAGGEWSKLIKFGPEINTPGDNANSAYISPDNKYLFFSSSRKNTDRMKIVTGTSLRTIIDSKSTPGNGASAIFWVSAKIIEQVKHSQ